MRSVSICFVLSTAAGIASGAAVAAPLATTACNANNCLRQVRASAFPTRSTSQDCSAYQTTYTTPLTTVTVTTSVASQPTPATSAPHTIPAYASSCNDDAEYRSACSCIGQKSTLITAPTSTVTVSSSPKPCSTLVVKATDGAFAGQYFSNDGSNDFVVFTAGGVPSALKLVLQNGRLYSAASPTKLLNTYPVENPYSAMVVLDDQDNLREGYTPFSCTIDPVALTLTCRADGGPPGFFEYGGGFGNAIDFGTNTQYQTNFIPKVEYVCSS